MAERRRSLKSIAAEGCVDELTDYTIYSRLSKDEKDRTKREIFSKLSAMEHTHYLFWKKYCPDREFKPDYFKVNYTLMLRRIFGESFLIKYLEGTESDAIGRYEGLRPAIPKKDRAEFETIIKDEEQHERRFAEHIPAHYARYMSFIILGLADALVEVAGIHAGSLGIYNSTLLTGLAGIIAGAAASLSMASAAYAQAKQGFEGSARTAAMYTGVSYFAAAVILASPYFFIGAIITALIVSLLLGFAMIALVSWYNSVMSGSNARREFTELTGIMVSVTVLLLILGFVIRHTLGITI